MGVKPNVAKRTIKYQAPAAPTAPTAPAAPTAPTAPTLEQLMENGDKTTKCANKYTKNLNKFKKLKQKNKVLAGKICKKKSKMMKKMKKMKKKLSAKAKNKIANCCDKIIIAKGSINDITKFKDVKCFDHFLDIATDWSVKDHNINAPKIYCKSLFKLEWNDYKNIQAYIFADAEWTFNYMIVRCKIFKEFDKQNSTIKNTLFWHYNSGISISDLMLGFFEDINLYMRQNTNNISYNITEHYDPSPMSRFIFAFAFTHHLYMHSYFFSQLSVQQKIPFDLKRDYMSKSNLNSAFGNIFMLYRGCITEKDYNNRKNKIYKSNELVNARIYLRKFKLKTNNIVKNHLKDQGKCLLKPVYDKNKISDKPSNQMLFQLANLVAILRSSDEIGKINRCVKMADKENDQHKKLIFFLCENKIIDKLMKKDLEMLESLLLIGLYKYETMLLKLLSAFNKSGKIAEHKKMAKIFIASYEEVLENQNGDLQNSNKEKKDNPGNVQSKGLLSYFYNKLIGTIIKKNQQKGFKLDFDVVKGKEEEFCVTILQTFVFYSDLFIASQIRQYYYDSDENLSGIRNNTEKINITEKPDTNIERTIPNNIQKHVNNRVVTMSAAAA
ncbi:hypothetical protein BDAP_000753 [Binucleata daphniae]